MHDDDDEQDVHQRVEHRHERARGCGPDELSSTGVITHCQMTAESVTATTALSIDGRAVEARAGPGRISAIASTGYARR